MAASKLLIIAQCKSIHIYICKIIMINIFKQKKGGRKKEEAKIIKEELISSKLKTYEVAKTYGG